MNELSNTLEDLLTEQQLKEYRSKEYPFNTNFLGTILKEKLKEDPDYEVWVELIYCKQITRVKDRNKPSVIRPYGTYISNKGRFCKIKKTGIAHIPFSIAHGYPSLSVYWTINQGCLIALHRALATCFVPLPPELKSYHPKDLQVNHIDGVKTNFELGNLEWTTDLGNKLHAVESGLIKSGKDSVLTKPVKGKIKTGPYAGHEFILHGLADYKKYGFTQQNILACAKGRVGSHKNCSWSYATESELINLPHGLCNEIKNSLTVLVKSKN